MNTLLIANRGEIAVRLIRACREMGIRAVAVHSKADATALHVRGADQAVLLGPAPSAESYLRGDKIIQAALATGAQAIHPGYGFLSENADFAEAVLAAGLIFVGPSPQAIRLMGDKIRARSLMEQAGVPVVPSYSPHPPPQAPPPSPEFVTQERGEGWPKAEEMGEAYPLLVKASAGGGGRGMRVVREPGELAAAMESAQREAAQAFGDGTIFLEKYIEHARHIEFQVLGDAHGGIVHLFERECSVQRRHQKIIEETPSSLLDDDLRAQMAGAAVQAARAVDYQNAGTVEFIVDPATRQFYFLEMNTRLQVEHPITEWVTGLDLVQTQLRVAAGEPLPFTQADLASRGHALECRLYAEDAENGFLPATGPVLKFVEPRGPGVRVDSGIETGDAVTYHYDPLLAKITAYGRDRAEALDRMQRALSETVLLGVRSNLSFLQVALAHPIFQRGEAATDFVETHLSGWRPEPTALPDAALVAAALAQLNAPQRGPASSAPGEASSPWARADGFRLGG